MKYCTRCLYPDTKPDLTFDENGVCSACQAFEARKNIDWRSREQEFKEICESMRYEVSSAQPYHCIIPVSGGKDSHYQIIKALDYDLNPLAVTAITDDLSYIGRRNLDNISKLGVDHVFVATNARLRRNINRYTLETIGDISWAEHITIFTIPIREAIIRNIPCVLWGENPQNEYGAPNKDSATELRMKPTWLDEFGGLNGLRPQDLINAGIADEHELYQYFHPFKEFDKERYPNNLFLGQYFEWDGWNNAFVASRYGFEQVPDHQPVEASGFCYENLDNHQTGIHDRFKYLKFGFGRATDLCCNHIRRERMSRGDAIEHIKKWDGNFPETYLGKPLEEILEPLNLYLSEYLNIEKKFANHDLFDTDRDVIMPKFKVGVGC